jgi:hypothetical protein
MVGWLNMCYNRGVFWGEVGCHWLVPEKGRGISLQKKSSLIGWFFQMIQELSCRNISSSERSNTNNRLIDSVEMWKIRDLSAEPIRYLFVKKFQNKKKKLGIF